MKKLEEILGCKLPVYINGDFKLPDDSKKNKSWI